MLFVASVFATCLSIRPSMDVCASPFVCQLISDTVRPTEVKLLGCQSGGLVQIWMGPQI